MSKETKAGPVPGPGGKVTGSSTAMGSGKRSPDELPDGSGNDSEKQMTPEDKERYDAG